MKFMNNKNPFDDEIEVGDVIETENGKFYVFSVNLDEEAILPYNQIDIETFKVVDMYPQNLFHRLEIGDELEIGGEVLALHKGDALGIVKRT